jgi:hypothetical protein
MTTNPVYDEERVLAHKILVNTLNALGAESTFLPPHLYELHRPTAGRQPKIDIVNFYTHKTLLNLLLFRFLSMASGAVHFTHGVSGMKRLRLMGKRHVYGQRFSSNLLHIISLKLLEANNLFVSSLVK